MRYIYLLAILLACFDAKTQDTLNTKGLKIGDHVPDFKLSGLINNPTTQISLKEQRGKITILEFWNSNCASCIESWPKLLELQNKHQKEVKIILVNTSENQKIVQSLIDRRKRLTGVNMTLPISCNDQNIASLFPHKIVPHVVWINQTGTVTAITSGNDVNEENINKAGSGKLTTPSKNEKTRYDVDFSKPLFINGNGGPGDHLKYSSMLSEFYPGLFGATIIDSTYGVISNATLPTMLRFLYKEETNRFGIMNFYPFGRTELRVKDSTQFLSSINSVTQYQNYYTYQFFSKEPISKSKMTKLMVKDLEKYFNVKVTFELQQKICLVLSIGDESLFTYKNGPLKINASTDKVEMNDVTIDEFLQHLVGLTKYHLSPYPFVNNTNYTGKLGGILIEGNIMSWKELASHLKDFGLILTLEERAVEVLVISDSTDI